MRSTPIATVAGLATCVAAGFSLPAAAQTIVALLPLPGEPISATSLIARDGSAVFGVSTAGAERATPVVWSSSGGAPTPLPVPFQSGGLSLEALSGSGRTIAGSFGPDVTTERASVWRLGGDGAWSYARLAEPDGTRSSRAA